MTNRDGNAGFAAARQPIGTSVALAAALLSTTAVADETAQGQPVRGEIIVTASPLARTSSELAIPVTVLDRSEIVRGGGATIGELLADQPGITASSFARGASRPIIRGLDNFRVRIQENGLGSQDVSALSEDHGIPIDPLSAQRIEVIRGPATLRYGSEAIGGVVSILNNRIPTAAPEGGIDGEVYVAYGTVDQGLESGALAEVGNDKFAAHLDVFHRDSESYDIPDTPGEQANTQIEQSGIAGGGSFLFGNGHIGAAVSYFESEYGIPGGEAAADGLFLDVEQTKVSLSGAFDDLGSTFNELRFDAGYADYTHDEVEGASGDVGSRFDNEEWEARAEVLHTPLAGFEGALGLQFQTRDLSASGEGGELIAPSERTSIAGFLFEEIGLSDNMTLQLGARVEHVEAEGFGVTPPSFNGNLLAAEIDDFGASADLDFTPVSASAGLVTDLGDDISFGANLQYVERAPDLLELFAKGPHEATETFEIGDPNLDKERALSAELTLKREEGPVTFEAAAYYTAYSDFIFKDFTGFVCGEEFDTCGVEGAPGVEDELTQIAYTQEDADFYGFELSGAWDAFQVGNGTLGFDGRFDYVRAELDNGDNLPRIPPLRYGAGVFYEDGGLFARLSALRVREQDDTAPGETETDGYTDLRAELTYTIERDSGGAIEIGVIGTNLLDEEARNHVSFKKEDVLLPGAGARAFVRVRF